MGISYNPNLIEHSIVFDAVFNIFLETSSSKHVFSTLQIPNDSKLMSQTKWTK